MPHYLSDEELKRTAPAEIDAFRAPIPTHGSIRPMDHGRHGGAPYLLATHFLPAGPVVFVPPKRSPGVGFS
jgi:hypothetical protein